MRAGRSLRAKSASWFKMGADLAMLGVEAQMVIGQRMAMVMLGGPKARTKSTTDGGRDGQGGRRVRGDDRSRRYATDGGTRLSAKGAGEPPEVRLRDAVPHAGAAGRRNRQGRPLIIDDDEARMLEDVAIRIGIGNEMPSGRNG